MLGEGEWMTRKHGVEYRRQWRKAHFGIDVFTLEIHAMEVNGNSIGGAVLPALLDQIPVEEKIASVSGDGANDTKDCHEAIALRVAHAIIQCARTPNPGRQLAAVRMHATTFCTRRAGWVGRFGKSRAVVIGAVLPKLKCAASRYWKNASWHGTSTVKSPNFMCERLYLTASLSWVRLLLSQYYKTSYKLR